jgi:DNA (cytosine-5)-methyltransferase 1
MIKVGSDFSGVGAFNQALIRLGKPFKEVFACDMDKYARQTFIENYGEPEYFPTNVYEREIPIDSLDIYMTSPPCQAFSLAGKRLGKEDKRGILFFNSHEFIQVNKPRFFIFENVKGLLSDNDGKTFSEWVAMLGGKSINGNPIIFPYEDSAPYHLYWKVLNAKEHGVPQNRERVFLIGIRDDKDNKFQFPKEEHLTKRLKDVLQDSFEDKYFLSEKMIELLTFETKGNYEVANTNKGGQKGIIQSENGEAISCLSATDYKQPKQILIGDYRLDEGFRWRKDGNCPTIPARARQDGSAQPIVTQRIIKVGNTNPSGNGMNGNVFDEQGIAPILWSGHGEGIKIKSNYVRRLTPRECFRLMDFPDSFNWTCSDSQAYKQAGNSIVVNVIYKILKQLPL